MSLNKKAKKILTTILLIYLCLVGGLYFAQRCLVFFPDRTKPDITPYLNAGIAETSVTTSDGLTLSGWLKKPKAKKEIILFFHGNAGHYGHRMFKAASYIQEGYGVVLAGYRGYGGNAGKPSEQGFYKDARAWINQLIESGIASHNIIIYGESIGTGVAVQMATEFPDIKALVLESPYTSLPDVAAKTYFFIPVHLLMKDKFKSLNKIKNVKAPLLVLQGLQDRVIPAVLGEKLFDAANDPKEIYQLKDYGHNDMPDDLMSAKVMGFVE